MCRGLIPPPVTLPQSTAPLQLSYTELYDLDGCCNFVADFMAYEGLEDPLHPPEHLPSPMSALGWQVCDDLVVFCWCGDVSCCVSGLHEPPTRCCIVQTPLWPF